MTPSWSDRRDPSDAPSAAPERPRFDVSEGGGTAVVKIFDGALVRAEDISALEVHLEHLIGAGHDRVALDLSEVSRVSRRAADALIRLQRRYRQAGVGLRVRAIQPQVAAGLGLAMPGAQAAPARSEASASANVVSNAADTNANRTESVGSHSSNGHAHPAIRDGQPQPPVVAPAAFASIAPEAMYFDATTTLDFSIAEILEGLNAPVPAPPEPAITQPPPEPQPATSSQRADADTLPPHVRLIVRAGTAAGQVIEVRGPKFVIGRDARCQLRAKGQFVSRVHASVECREGKVFVRDEGSSNGTAVNGRSFRNAVLEVVDGDHLDIGRMRFTIAIARPPAEPESGAPASVERPRGSAPQAPDSAGKEFWSGVQFTCSIQPGSLVQINAAPEVRTEAAPASAVSAASQPTAAAFGSGHAALEHLLQELLRMVRSGALAGGAAAPPAPRPTAPKARPAAADARPAPGPQARGASRPTAAPSARPGTAREASRGAEREPRFAATMDSGDPADSDIGLLLGAIAPLAIAEDEPEAPNAVSGVGLDIETLVEEAATEPRNLPSLESLRQRPESGPTTQPELVLQFECPVCEEPGQVPFSRIGSLFHCNRCQADFRINPHGTTVLGEDEPRMSLWKKAAAAATLVFVLLMGYAIASGPLLFGSPTSLSSHVLKAAADNSPDRLKQVALQGSERSTRRWMRIMGSVLKNMNERGIKPRITLDSRDEQTAKTTARFLIDPSGAAATKDVLADAPKAGPKPSPNGEEEGVLTVSLYWFKFNGNWYLDGRRTLRGASAIARKYALMVPRAR